MAVSPLRNCSAPRIDKLPSVAKSNKLISGFFLQSNYRKSIRLKPNLSDCLGCRRYKEDVVAAIVCYAGRHMTPQMRQPSRGG